MSRPLSRSRWCVFISLRAQWLPALQTRKLEVTEYSGQWPTNLGERAMPLASALLRKADKLMIKDMSAWARRSKRDRRFCVPHEFKLNVPHDEIRQNCRVVWRKEALIGLAFELAA